MSNYKYYYLVEGQMEEKIFKWLKNNQIKAKKLSLCKNPNHPKSICEGTIQLNKIKKCDNCSKTILIFDYDDIKNIEEYKKKDCLAIISKPSIEIVLLAIFNVPESEISKKDIEIKLNNFLKKYDIKYNHNIESLVKILNLIESNNKLFNDWIKNLQKLKELNKSNFIELYKFLEGYKGE